MTRFAMVAAVVVLGLVGGGRDAEGETTIDFSQHHNARMQDFGTAVGTAADYPEGLVTLGGVRFAIPGGGLNTWSAAAAAVGDLPVAIDVAVGAFGVEAVHLLLTTHKGESLPGAFASLEFFGSGGAYFAKELDGGVDVRDWLFSEYTNSVNGTTTVEVFAAGSGFQRAYRLDMLTVALPAEFRSQTLQSIRISDRGAFELQRLHVHGITVSAVPEPSTLALTVSAMLAALAGWRWRRRRAA